MITLETVAGVQARIFNLPGREPFMLADDLAEAYASVPMRINQAVKRNLERFPDDFFFRLTEAEVEGLKSQNVILDPRRALPSAFTHAGAYALSAVLKTPIAAKVSVTIHRAFAAMEREAMEDMRIALEKAQMDALGVRGPHERVKRAVEQKWPFRKICLTFGYSGPRVQQIVANLLDRKVIAGPPAGTPGMDQLTLFSPD